MGGQPARFGLGWRGWKAVCFIAALATGLIYSACHTRDAAADEVAEPLRQKLRAEYSLPQVSSTDGLRFRSITARGLFRTLWVRVEIEVDGRDPPDGRPVRYFRWHRSAALGQWLLDGETTALAYHLPF